jgi:hypothetical protein
MSEDFLFGYKEVAFAEIPMSFLSVLFTSCHSPRQKRAMYNYNTKVRAKLGCRHTKQLHHLH